MKISTFLASIAIVACATTAFAATTADVIFVVDESGSMGQEHAWLSGMVANLEADLVAAGVTGNRYGLVGFGASSAHGIPGHQHDVGGVGSQFGTAAQFGAATGSLVLNGSQEDGYSGILSALGYAFRANAAVNIVLVTDEDRDFVNGSLAQVLNALGAENALLNVVINGSFEDGANAAALGIDGNGNAYLADGFGGFTASAGGNAVSGAGTTITDYVNPAISIGGAAWDLNQLRAGGLTAQSFTEAFVDIKVTEIVDQGIPEPGTLILLGGGLGLMGLVSVRRRRNRKAA